MADTGIFFISKELELDAIDHYGFTDWKVTRIGRLSMRAGEIDRQMHVSPDGGWALVSTQGGYTNSHAGRGALKCGIPILRAFGCTAAKNSCFTLHRLPKCDPIDRYPGPET